MTKYDQETEQLMLRYYSHLGEKEQRHYAALEAQKLGHGGKALHWAFARHQPKDTT